MLTSRNIHFAILGIILGASSGYILAFYQVKKAMPPPAISAPGSSSSTPENHPDVTNEELLAMFKEAMEKSPNDPKLMTRYGTFLFQLGKFPEARGWFEKVLVLQPNDIDVRVGLVVVHLQDRDFPAAEKVLKEIERIDPKYAGLDELKKRLAIERGPAK